MSLSFEDALHLTSEPIAVFDAEARLSASNRALRTGLKQMEAILLPGTPWPLILSEAARTGVLSETDTAALRMIEERYLDRPDAQPEVIVTLADGRRALAELCRVSGDGFALVLRPQSGSDGMAESELEELMSKVLQACPSCLIMSRIGDGRVLYRSPSATELLGKGFNSLDHFAHRAERADFLTALLPQSRVDDMRVTARAADGGEFPASVSARLIDYRGEDVIVASVLDLTERLATEDEIERQKRQLFQLEKMSALGEVLSGIAHELNNPLSVVVGNAHLLLEEDVPDDLRPRLERMTGAAERCVRIVRTFLAMARNRPLDLAICQPPTLITAAADAFEASDEHGTVTLVLDVAEGLPALKVDEVQIVQVLVNIMTNAAQAMTSAGIGDRIHLEAVTHGGGVRIALTDNGPGVPSELADRIFDPLFTTKEAGEGTGLGLALCHRIMVSHGGAISLKHPQAGGARFVLDLPAAG